MSRGSGDLGKEWSGCRAVFYEICLTTGSPALAVH